MFSEVWLQVQLKVQLDKAIIINYGAPAKLAVPNSAAWRF
jgi:hypothetical protein